MIRWSDDQSIVHDPMIHYSWFDDPTIIHDSMIQQQFDSWSNYFTNHDLMIFQMIQSSLFHDSLQCSLPIQFETKKHTSIPFDAPS